ncbi:MAG: hypothetical protein M4579_000425 [Chaenotheca gracillima]|nr:MAG: hypothetical protein M4579_000425 [Chaenotheca gracillima]
MATYEVEHNIPSPPRTTVGDRSHPEPPPRRPDLSTFFTALSAVDTSSTQNAHAVPTPGDVSVAYRMLASAFEVMRRDGGEGGDTSAPPPGTAEQTSDSGAAAAGSYTQLMDMLIESLLHDADSPPREVKGCSQEYLDDRVDLLAKKEAPKSAAAGSSRTGGGTSGAQNDTKEEEEEEWDDMYA